MSAPRETLGVIEHTDWRCERCGKSGRIDYVRGAGVYEVLHILEDAHSEADTENVCKGDIAKIRLTPVPVAPPEGGET